MDRVIRQFQDEDESAVIAVWHSAGQASYTYIPTWQALTLAHATRVFQEVICPNNQLWVGTLDGEVVGYLAVNGSYIDRLYIHPHEWRQGWGTRFINLAKQLSPNGLKLQTHQQNRAARALYEKHGFRAVRYGLSPPPESLPDVEYHWQPIEG